MHYVYTDNIDPKRVWRSRRLVNNNNMFTDDDSMNVFTSSGWLLIPGALEFNWFH